MRRATMALMMLMAGSACSTTPHGRPPAPAAQATLAAPDGSARGTASLSVASGGLALQVEAAGLPPGAHGIHIHTTGRCDAPDFQTAGPHWNPTSRQHGRENPQGTHQGDLPNITIGADGQGVSNVTLPDATLDGLLDADGAALVVHAAADDDRTDPSGNSGARIACGVVSRR